MYGDEPNSIVVIDYDENLRRIDEYLAVVDIAPKQVLIEARVVEVKLQGEHALGINWEYLRNAGIASVGEYSVTGDLTEALAANQRLRQAIPFKNTKYPPISGTDNENPFTLTIFNENISTVLKALANDLDTDILSAPSVTTVNNRPAEIKVIQTQPWAEPEVSVTDSGAVTITWTIHFEEVGISLNVTPIINDENSITLDLLPSVSEKVSDYQLTVSQEGTEVPYTVPIIDKREANTRVIVGDGQTIILGGLMRNRVAKGQSKIPLLGDIPLLGHLFKSSLTTSDKTELLIFVSPTIVDTQEMTRMTNNYRYGIGKEFYQQQQKKDWNIRKAAEQEKSLNDQAVQEIDSLHKEFSDLQREKQDLESIITKQKQDLKTLQQTKKAPAEKAEKGK